jgi:hypothetical protein
MIDDMEAYRCQLTQEDTTAMSILEPVNLSFDYMADPSKSQVSQMNDGQLLPHRMKLTHPLSLSLSLLLSLFVSRSCSMSNRSICASHTLIGV